MNLGKVRIAQTNLTCVACKKVIKIGHPYAWRQRTVYHPDRGKTIHLERIHPKCQN